jgi:hypothetical protein
MRCGKIGIGWRRGELWQLHLVNYAREMQSVAVNFGESVAGGCLSPDTATTIEGTESPDRFHGSELRLTLGVYAVLEYIRQASQIASRRVQ